MKNNLQDDVRFIKQNLSIPELVTQLGIKINNHKIKSIYHEERTPSLHLYNNSFKCYSSQNSGDIIKFYMDFKKVNFEQTINDLLNIVSNKSQIKNTCNKNIIELPQSNINLNNEKTQEPSTINNNIFKSLKMICDREGINPKVLKYLKGSKRKLTESTIKKFNLFTVNKVQDTINELKQIFDENQLKESGLFADDYFIFTKHQIVIPYYMGNQIVSLRGRYYFNNNWESGNNSKYMSLKKTKYMNEATFFNEDILNSLNKNDQLMICEGEFDTMIALQMGYNAIGIKGIASFPFERIEELQKYDIVFALDGDKAGRKGLLNIVRHFTKPINVLSLNGYKDLTESFPKTKSTIITLDPKKIIQIENSIKFKKQYITAAELSKKKIIPITWIIKNLLSEGLAILAAKPKAGKSLLMLYLSLMVANGQKALNYFDSTKSKVLYIPYEDNESRIQRRIKNISYGAGIINKTDNLIFPKEYLNFPKLNSGGIERIKEYLTLDPQLKLIVIDTYGRSKTNDRIGNSNQFQEEYDYMGSLQQIAMEFKTCIIFLHHTRKSASADIFDEISGTRGLTASADTLLVLSKAGAQFNLHVKGRDIQDETYKLEFNERNYVWQVTGTSPNINLTPEQNEILDLFKSDPNLSLRTSVIAKTLKRKDASISRTLKKLCTLGLIEKVIGQKYKLHLTTLTTF